MFIASHLHHAARDAGEHLATLLDSLTASAVDVRLISADANQSRESARWLVVEVHATRNHHAPDVESPEAVAGVLPLVLDLIEGEPVPGFGIVSTARVASLRPVREGVSVAFRLYVEGDPNPRFPLDTRSYAHAEEVAA
ncbi:hypothetical protein [Streptomyces thermodiastaticus]|uniref:hypothetical protein n=1 Tax=Streptomyces thermodiastaticus TaxID=44061 RepID=UPI0016795452|nr:hypothetical protein [Streptomyces thermodiastaticus]MCE7552776.1 hypothetical protein [Streptomyces thermodiastaticus]GHF88989.1 hypothetical protein GCM10018787_42080 [Streptomyces thermodiastaticus]